MLSKAQLLDLFDHLSAPPAGSKLVQEARVHAPVCKVASRGGIVITYVTSRKMVREIATESTHLAPTRCIRPSQTISLSPTSTGSPCAIPSTFPNLDVDTKLLYQNANKGARILAER